MMSDKRCIGCGGHLQNTDSEMPFFTPKSLDKPYPIYCERCFKIRHYGNIKPSFVSEEVILDTLYEIKKRPGVMVLMADALDFYGSIHPFFIELSLQKRTLLVINKIDLLPKSIKHGKLETLFLKKAQSYGLKVDECLVVSAMKNIHIDELLAKMLTLSKGQDLYLMGLTNVGKSSVLNAILESKNGPKNQITTSLSPHMTQGLIPFKMNDQVLYDTPGLSHKHTYRYFLHNDSLKKIIPSKEIKPKTFQHLSSQAFYIGGLVILVFDQVKGSMTTFLSDQLPIHHKNQRNFLEFYQEKVTGFLNPPSTYDPLEPLKKSEFQCNLLTTLILPGLGFIELRHVDQVTVYHYESVNPLIEESFFA